MKRLVVGISGASGVQLGIEFLRAMRSVTDWETHLVITNSAIATIQLETELETAQVYGLADFVYAPENIGASIASGSFQTEGMVVVPCSMKSLAGIVSGYSDNLLLRAADVTMKEGRKLVLVPRETPLSRIHIRNMLEACDNGAVILPPMMAYYGKPVMLEDLTNHIVGKILDQFHIDYPGFKRWEN